jgi:hypothetical protein
MTDRKNQQRFLKGAFVEVPVGGTSNEPLKPIYFQFNPETIERIKTGTWTSAQSQRQKAEDVADKKEFDKLKGKKVKAGFMPAPEKINITLRLDIMERILRSPAGTQASDQATEGVLPELAALENLMKKNTTQVSVAGSQNAPTMVRTREIPLVLFVWGNYRVIPVTVISMTITEQRFDTLLTPVRAEIRVSLQVLEEEDAKLNDQAFRAFQFTEDEKRRMKDSFLENQQNANRGMPVPSGYPIVLEE